MEERIYRILYEIRPDSDFKHSKDFIEEGLLDSIDIMELFLQLEEEFNVSIDFENVEFENIASIDGILSLIGK